MRHAEFGILVILPILFVHGVSFDYAQPDDFKSLNLSEDFQVLSGAEKTEKCKKGTAFRVACNKCNCNKDTGQTLCTVMKCSSNWEMNQWSQETQESLCRQPNEEYDLCGASCPATCDRDALDMCHTNCLPGCRCKKGYVRDLQDNRCVRPEQCQKTEKCKNGTSYRVACNRCNCNKDTGQTVCTVMKCSSHWGMNQWSQETREQSELCLEPNEEYDLCGASCPATCYRGGLDICHTNCLPGCRCKKGYVRDLQDNRCVRPEQCQGPPISNNKCKYGTDYNYGCTYCFCDPIFGDTICAEDEDCKRKEKNKEGASKCKPGSYSKRGCNICYCDPVTRSSTCTKVACHKNKKKLSTRLSFQDQQLYNKLKEGASQCKPYEEAEIGPCFCQCKIPSVLTCKCKSTVLT